MDRLVPGVEVDHAGRRWRVHRVLGPDAVLLANDAGEIVSAAPTRISFAAEVAITATARAPDERRIADAQWAEAARTTHDGTGERPMDRTPAWHRRPELRDADRIPPRLPPDRLLLDVLPHEARALTRSGLRLFRVDDRDHRDLPRDADPGAPAGHDTGAERGVPPRPASLQGAEPHGGPLVRERGEDQGHRGGRTHGNDAPQGGTLAQAAKGAREAGLVACASPPGLRDAAPGQASPGPAWVGSDVEAFTDAKRL